MFGIIYIITNTINSKLYIGQTSRSLNDRWKEHCRENCSEGEYNMAIKRAIIKYGKENFTIKELEKCEIDQLDEREIYYISLYNSYKDGYNLTAGGKSGCKDLKLSIEKQQECLDLYMLGFSLRYIAKEYNIDKGTVKHIIEKNNIPLRNTRTYKLSQEERQQIVKDSHTMNRKQIMDKWNISKSYLSQLLSGKRRI